MPRPAQAISPHLLPGAILLPTYYAHCVRCEESTHHAGLGDEDGRELGSHCLSCGTPSRVSADRYQEESA